MPKFIMLVGLPGSGKSTYANKLTIVERVTKHISSDKIREELYGDESIQGDSNKVFRILHERVKKYLEEGYDVVYDATNVTRKNRRSIIEEIKHLCDEGLEAHIVWAPYTQCVSRDKDRKRSVGEDVIRKFLYRWQSPNYDEGFTNIDLIFNCNVGWNAETYRNNLIEGMKIPHNNPHHTLSVYEHCKKVRDSFDIKCQNNLYEAAFYHDIGKPFTKCYKSNPENGKIDYSVAHYYQHDNVGGYLVYGIYELQDKMRAIQTSWLVCNHMQPYFDSNYYKSLKGWYKEYVDKLHAADVAAH